MATPAIIVVSGDGDGRYYRGFTPNLNPHASTPVVLDNKRDEGVHLAGGTFVCGVGACFFCGRRSEVGVK